MKGYLKYQVRVAKIQKTKKLPQSPIQILADMPTAVAVVLTVVAAAGITSVAVVAPNALQLLKVLMKRSGKIPTDEEVERKFVETVYYLKKTGRIRLEGQGDSLWLKLGRLTKRDKDTLRASSLVITKPDKWDGAYWLVAADIPTKTHRASADLLRKRLTAMSFYPLQRSLWLHPYDPTRCLQMLVDDLGLGQFVTLMRVDRIDTQDKATAMAFWKRMKVF